MGRLKKAPIIVLAGTVLLGGGLLYGVSSGLISPKPIGSAAVPMAAPLPTLADTATTPAAVALLPLPTTQKAAVPGPEIRFQEMAWQSQTGLNLANGGIYTAQGSLMEKHGVNLHIVWEDDVAKQMSALVNFAEALKKNPQPTEGAHFAALMGDGTAAMIGSIAKELADVGAEAEIVGSAGYSRGEDQLMGPPSWKTNPQAARGSLVSVFMYDGDWNIVMKYAGDNNIPVNPDVKTYDPSAINFYSADDFVKAAAAYVDNVCEDRPVVQNGKRTGEKKNVCVNAVSTWTPADVTVAEKKGGLATIVSTKDYYYQMPNTIIGIKKWNQANKPLVVKMLAAMFEAADQVKAYPQALRRGCEANSIIWSSDNGAGRQPAEYWEKYFRGVTITDRQGVTVSLGGSSVNNLQDNLLLYGLTGGANAFASTYTLFGNIAKAANPKITTLPVEKVLNTEYVQAVKAEFGQQVAMPADAPKKVEAAVQQVTHKIGDRSYQINFDTGKSSFSPDSLAQLTALKDGLVVAGDSIIEIHGHTDNTGDPARNQALSASRAQAVKDWMVQQGVDRDRFVKVQGHGDSDPVATNETETGRAKNRRVGIVIGK
jgi:outer membrane protein OmpA-like peptidoglycan-associated protein